MVTDTRAITLSRTKFLAALLALATAVSLSACGGNTAANTNTNTNTSGDSTAVITAGDAPMSSVLAALVTISAVSFTSSSGTVQLLNQPRMIELTQLGGIRAPIDLHALPQGTYTSISITVSAAQITYIDPTTQQVVQANATIPSASATTSITLTNPLVVSDSSATDIRFDFDLSQSLDLTNGVVTFTPVISAAVANAKNENNSQRQLYINGTITATSTTANTITLTTTDSDLTVTLNVTSSTQFDDNLTLASLQTGTVIDTVDMLNDDGSITALQVDDSDAGESEGSGGRVDGGIVTAVTRDTNNNLTAFTMVIRDSMHASNLGKMLTVNVSSSTTFKDSMNATNAGLTTFDQTQVFPGQGVWVSGAGSGSNTVAATEIRPLAVSPYGLTNAAVQTITGGFSISLLLDANTNFAQFAGISTLTVDTNANTVFDGQTLTSSNVANLTTGTPLVARGFLSLTGTTDTLYCDHLHELGASE